MGAGDFTVAGSLRLQYRGKENSMNKLKKLTGLGLSVCLVLGSVGFEGLTVKAETTDVGLRKVEFDSDKKEGLSGDYFNIPFQVKSADNSKLRSKLRGAVPAKYDPRSLNKVTSIKNQGRYGCCWSFAAMNGAESDSVVSGTDKNNIDLSELQFAHYFYNRETDPLGGTAGDKNISYKKDYLDNGGNNYLSTFAMASWAGAAQENLLPYSQAAAVQQDGVDNNIAYQDAKHLQNAYWISMKDHVLLKSLIKQYGSAAVSYYSQGDYYDNGSTVSYFCNTTYSVDHAVSIVGWDDNYSVDNFRGRIKPQKNGAWLVKNSWGRNWGSDDGYFWISYEDTSLNGAASREKATNDAVIFDVQNADNYDHNYQYDGTASFGHIYNIDKGTPNFQKDIAYTSNIFTAQGYETLKAVSFYTVNPGDSYSIQIYTDVKDGGSPTSGKAAFSSELTGSEAYVGYHTIPLEQNVPLRPGERYSVVVKIKSADTAYFLLDENVSYEEFITFVSNSEKGQSYISGDGTYWSDISASGNCNVRIKAFTDNGIELSAVSGLKIQANYQGAKLTWNIVPGASGYYIYRYNSIDGKYNQIANVKSTSFTDSGLNEGATYKYQVKAYTNGEANRLCLAPATNISVVTYAIVEKITLNASATNIIIVSNAPMSATISPQNAYNKGITWSSDNKAIASVTSTGQITGLKAGTTVIRAKSKDGGAAGSYKIKVVPAVTKITVSPYSYKLAYGKTVKPKVTISPSNAGIKTVKWTTSNSKVATVSTSGVVTGKGVGTATITATTVDKGKKAYFKVTVGNSITYKANGGSNSKSNPTFYYNQTVKLKNPTRKGYTFKGWYADSRYRSRVTSIKKGTKKNYTLYAKWAKVSKPGRVSLSSARNVSSRKLKIGYRKASSVNGYEIVYAKNSRFTKSKATKRTTKTSYTTGRLTKKATYYVRVRAYRTDSTGRRIYGSYSKVKKVKISR